MIEEVCKDIMTEAEKQYTVEDWYNSADEGAAEEQFQGGGGVIGKMRLDLGYKVYIAGMTGEDLFKTFFPVANPTGEARALGLATAKAFGQANGATKNPQWVVCLTMEKDECVNLSGEAVEWSHNQQKTVPLWTKHVDGPSAAKLFMEKAQANRIPMNEPFYGRVAWVNDPYKESLGEAGKTDKDRDGTTMRFPTVAVIEDVYKSKESAQAAAAKFAAEAPGATAEEGAAIQYPWGDEFPGSWGDDEDWAEFANDVELALIEGDDAETYAEEELGEDLTFLIRALSVGGFNNKKIKDVTDLKMSVIKKALALD